MVIRFYDENNVVQRTGKVLLNYLGWRDYNRDYITDYNGGSTLPTFNLNKFTITYKPFTAGDSTTIFLDEITFAGNSNFSVPGTHLIIDYNHFKENPVTNIYGNPLRNWRNVPDIIITTPTVSELSSLVQVKAGYTRTIDTPINTEITKAKNYVIGCGITRNADSSIKGRPLNIGIENVDTLLLLSSYSGILGKAYLLNNDTDAQDKLALFTEYLLDQGLAEGGRIVLKTDDYAPARSFPAGFLEALGAYSTSQRADIIKMLKWSVEYNKIYAASFTPGFNTDYLLLKSNFLFELACASPANDSAIRDLKSAKRFMERNVIPGQGSTEGLKPDGTGFHHQVHYMGYMTAFGAWIDNVYPLTGTDFKISETGYNDICRTIKSMFLESSKGQLFSHAESGRNPFPGSMPVSCVQMKKLIDIGGDVKGIAYDTTMSAFYNYIYDSASYNGVKAKMDGFYHYNYAQLGAFRKKNWVAVMKGFTDRLFGSEIFAAENRYGRYQSYGSLEILYDGSLKNSGYINNGNGWDWNTMPGTTTVHLPYERLKPLVSGKAQEYQSGSFAGALSLGNDGVFGMDFIQKADGNYSTSNLTFRKSVFAFDSLLICLGSSISTFNSLGNVATNLFQAIDSVASTSVYINSATPASGSYDSTLAIGANGLWMVNGQSTGFYIPGGNGTLNVIRGQQSTPLESSNSGTTASAYADKVWINHGVSPLGQKYQFTVIPAVTPTSIQLIASAILHDSVYQVLSQTDTLHSVKYIPGNSTSFVFFAAMENVNIGPVKSISDRILLGIKENADTSVGDTIIVTACTPDLNVTSSSSLNWTSNTKTINLVLEKNWDILENDSSISATNVGDSMVVSFDLIHGFSKSIKLVKMSDHISMKSVSVPVLSASQLCVFPNPTGGNIQLQYYTSSKDIIRIKIINQSGQILFNQSRNADEGDHHFNFKHLPLRYRRLHYYRFGYWKESIVKNL